jgi:hypothetical protein
LFCINIIKEIVRVIVSYRYGVCVGKLDFVGYTYMHIKDRLKVGLVNPHSKR